MVKVRSRSLFPAVRRGSLPFALLLCFLIIIIIVVVVVIKPSDSGAFS